MFKKEPSPSDGNSKSSEKITSAFAVAGTTLAAIALPALAVAGYNKFSKHDELITRGHEIARNYLEQGDAYTLNASLLAINASQAGFAYNNIRSNLSPEAQGAFYSNSVNLLRAATAYTNNYNSVLFSSAPKETQAKMIDDALALSTLAGQWIGTANSFANFTDITRAGYKSQPNKPVSEGEHISFATINTIAETLNNTSLSQVNYSASCSTMKDFAYL
jgi:hypothetical protein